MPTTDNSQPKDNPFEIVTSGKAKKGSTKGVIIALVVVLFLALGIFGGVLLVRQNQNIQEKAACAAACPNSNGDLVNCYDTPDTDGEVSTCNSTGRVEVCGQNISDAKEYCCPAAGGAWTTNMSACAVSTPTATATATSTSTATATATATSTSTSSATSTATSTSQATTGATPTKSSTAKATTTAKATKAPIPETGTGWPTYAGIGLGIFVIIGSLLLAL